MCTYVCMVDGVCMYVYVQSKGIGLMSYNVLCTSGTYESNIKFHLEVNSHFYLSLNFRSFQQVVILQGKVIEKTLEQTCSLQKYEKISFCCFKPCSFWEFVTVALGNL